jgi:DNA-binding IclR family transcriptional regulator
VEQDFHVTAPAQGTQSIDRAGEMLARLLDSEEPMSLRDLSEQPMAVLAEETGETINLAVAGGDGVSHIAQVDGRHFLGTTQWVGRRVPYHCSANGKVLLAYGAAALPDGPLEALTSRTVVDRRALKAQLDAIRRDGHANAIDELELGLSATAAPVFDASGRTVAALSVSGPTLRLSPRRIAELQANVIKQARALSELLGHRQEGVHAA